MLLRLTTFTRLFSTASRRRIAIVGSGPAGLYAAQRVLKKTNSVQVDVFDKLPFPFGLLRLGVAPDHQSVKVFPFQPLFFTKQRLVASTKLA